MENNHDQRCGFVVIAGLPNAGKSTLVNRIVGEKVSITSPKRGTTRARTLGIAIKDSSQLILADTPGIDGNEGKKSKLSRLEQSMNASAWDAISGAHASVLLVDANIKNQVARNEALIRAIAQNTRGQAFLAINKVDKVSRQSLLPLAGELNEMHDYAATFMISATQGSGVDDLAKTMFSCLPKSPWLFEEDQITDAPLRLAASEIVREQVFRRFHSEIPYSTMVETEGWEEFDNGSVKISATISVERSSQKAIILGKGGASLKSIGISARKELSEMLGRAVHLKLFVRVSPNWQEKSDSLRAMGLL